MTGQETTKAAAQTVNQKEDAAQVARILQILGTVPEPERKALQNQVEGIVIGAALMVAGNGAARAVTV